jgi:hypothetical protein
MKRLILAAAAAASLAACASPPPPRGAETGPRQPPPRQTPAPPRGDQCGAAEHQQYVGRPKTEIPVPVEPAFQRVACTTCPVTMEFIARRLNFFFDPQTGIIKEVRCG